MSFSAAAGLSSSEFTRKISRQKEHARRRCIGADQLKKYLLVGRVKNKLGFVINTIRKCISNRSVPCVTGILVLFVCGCSSFNRAWRDAESTFVPGSMEGRWEGRWLSNVNGHNGKLLCIVSRREDGETAARFRATYMKVVRFSYTVPLKVEHTNGAWHFRGEENLGRMAGGVYKYEGNATPSNFHSTYRSKYDHGVFEMERPSDNAAQPSRKPAN